jgi:type VI secretion system protein ImpF
MSLNEYRAQVRRDLAWLLNTANLAAVLDLDEYPEVADSVVNFGVPDIAGLTSSCVDANELQKALKKIIIRFEPRLVPRSLRIGVEVNADELNHNAMCFVINGDLRADPSPVPISLRSELDLETGQFSVRENTR